MSAPKNRALIIRNLQPLKKDKEARRPYCRTARAQPIAATKRHFL
jgi:hypothetical protein